MRSCAKSYMLKRMLLLLLVFISAAEARCQSDPIFTQFWALPTIYNPATTGSTDFIRFRAGGRLQWLGITNAPKSFIASADSPFKVLDKRAGAGVNFTQESLGLFSNLLVNGQLSYKIPVKKLKSRLSVGLQAGYYNSKFRGSDAYIPSEDDYHEPDDPAIPKQDLSGNAFDLSLGVEFSHPLFSVGLSALHLTSPEINMQAEGNETSETVNYQTYLKRTLYFTATGNIGVRNSLFQVHPSLIIASDFSGFTGDVSLRASYNRFLSFGIGYRWKEAISAMAGVEFKSFFLGYAYSYPLSAIAKASSGSHEIVAGYSLRLDLAGKNKNKQRSIRLM
ncbi:MAG: PorP/SprF family type IX secretion system membrane protein [Muribaculaceae bacterium]|nr:PorP/SprF family type IX secretion system membrane protein [Muribaculaceae bacterium]